GMATIDFHQHLWPEPLVNALRSRTAPPRIVDSRLELASLTFPFDPGVHVLANRLAELDRGGIDTAVVCLQPTLAAPLPREGVDYVGQMQVAYAAWLADGTSRWPGLPVVFAILAGGAPIQLERLAGRGLDVRSVLEADVYFDTASYGSRALELCLATYGVGRV